MPRFAANLTVMYPERPVLERFAAAAAGGFTAVECLFPYAFDPEVIAEDLRRDKLRQVIFNAVAGGFDGLGERGLAAMPCHGMPGRELEFLAGVDRAIEYAPVLGCPRLHAMAGLVVVDARGSGQAAQRVLYIENLREAARRCVELCCVALRSALTCSSSPLIATTFRVIF